MNNVEKHNLGHPTLIFESCKKAGGGGGGGGGGGAFHNSRRKNYPTNLNYN